jgi:glutathione S-transferase
VDVRRVELGRTSDPNLAGIGLFHASEAWALARVSGRPALQAYQQRCEARPAFQKALADHLKPFETAAA